MADKKKMSVAEMLAAARKQGAAGSGGTADESAAPEDAAAEAAAPQAEAPPAAEEKPKPAAKPAAKSGGGRPSVAEMMAMARAAKGGGEKPAASSAKEKPAAPAKPEPSPKHAAAEKPAASKPGGPKDTASILAAARKTAKPGPVSKAEAAAQGKPVAAGGKAKLAVPPMPEKPSYARKPDPKLKPQVDSGRRFALIGVLVGSYLALGFSAMAATVGLWTLGLARYMFPNILREPPSQFKVGFPSDFAPGQVETKFIAQFGVWVVNYEYNGEPQIYALQSVCTHLGCTPSWLEAEQKFKCPCHGSGFYKDGVNFEGPAPRPLERYAIKVADDGQLEVDKSRTFHEELGQWSDPASYVSV